MKNRNYAGFTLTEFFVVAVIILILGAMLPLPSLSKAKEDESQTICRNNLKQLYQIFTMYANDYDDYLPVNPFPGRENVTVGSGTTPWIYVLARAYPKKFKGSMWSKYGGRKFWHCPSCPLNSAEDSCSGGASDYGMNSLSFFTPKGTRTYKMSESAPRPSQKFLIADAPLPGCRPAIYPVIYSSISDRHNGGANYLFFDGHMEWLRKKDVYRWHENDWTAFNRALDQKPWNCDIK